ncbi:MAG: Cache 3/Cache 2 fusion domain-containing protein [Bacteroidales bacterium]|nr:Cache 3/Cache 2 fusion domain-containing protein [Bacteroidales bacterium]
MMKKVWAWINGSFTLQLCFWIILTTLLVFLCAFSVGLYFASENMKMEADEKANREIDFVQLFVEKELKGVSIAGENLLNVLQRQSIQRQFTPEELYDFFELFLLNNPQVQGIAIGFEPDVYPEIGEFCPYVLHLGNTMHRSDIQKKYAYRESPWYKNVKENRTPHWSNPFKESSDHHLIISTYSIPIIHENRFIGVLAVDLSLERLSKLVNSIKPYPNASLTVMDRQFMYICHTDTNKILTSSQDDVDTNELEVDKKVFADMINRKRGQATYAYQNKAYRFYYAPIHDADWTIAMHCPEDDILAEVKMLRKEMRHIGLIGTLVLCIICVLVIRKRTKPIKQFSEAAHSIA